MPGHWSGEDKSRVTAERSHDRGIPDPTLKPTARSMHDRRPGKPQTKNGHAVNPRIRACCTDVSSFAPTVTRNIASITSDGTRGEGGWLRLLGLTWDIRGWVEFFTRPNIPALFEMLGLQELDPTYKPDQ